MTWDIETYHAWYGNARQKAAEICWTRFWRLRCRNVEIERQRANVFLGTKLGGGFKYFLFSSLPGEMIQFH